MDTLNKPHPEDPRDCEVCVALGYDPQLQAVEPSIKAEPSSDVDSEILTTLRNIDALLDRAIFDETGIAYREPIEETDEPVAKHTFNRAVDAAFAASQAISNQRGGEYQDSWAIPNQSTHFLDSVLRLIDKTEDLYALGDISKEAKRLLMLAAMCDVKISRLGGDWKLDSHIDLQNYLAALTTLALEYQGLSY